MDEVLNATAYSDRRKTTLVHSFPFLLSRRPAGDRSWMSITTQTNVRVPTCRARARACVGPMVLIAVRVVCRWEGVLCGFIREIFGNFFFWGGLLSKDVSSPFEQLESVMCCGSPISRLRPIRCLSDSPYVPSSFISARSPAVPLKSYEGNIDYFTTRQTTLAGSATASHAPLVQLSTKRDAAAKSMQALAMVLAQRGEYWRLIARGEIKYLAYGNKHMFVYVCLVQMSKYIILYYIILIILYDKFLKRAKYLYIRIIQMNGMYNI